jgi:flavin-dependent dehydrogenase
MRNTPASVDAVIIGGGPAGAAAARFLAGLGREVLLLSGSKRGRPPLGESLPPSSRKPLAALGLIEAMESEGFVENRGNLSSWGEVELRITDFEALPGFQVERGRLDRLLLRSAGEVGARILEGATATRVELDRERPVVGWETERDRGQVQAKWVLDCSGRAGILARPTGARTDPSGPSTIALLGVWRTPAVGNPSDETRTLVESYEDGWAWSVPIDPDRRFVAAMVDPRETRLDRTGKLPHMYTSELGKTRHLSRRLQDATLERGPWGCAATPYAAHRYGGRNHLLVGDAGAFIDPLSSFGVKKALASGWLAAIVVNTVLGDSDIAGPGLALFEERERAVEATYAGVALHHYEIARRHHRTPFWEKRAGRALADGRSERSRTAPWEESIADSDSPSAERKEGGTSFSRTDPRLREALERLRAADPLRLEEGPGVRRIRTPTVQGTRIVMEDRLLAVGADEGIRHHLGVDLLDLTTLAPRCASVPELYEAYTRRRSPAVSLPEFLEALSALVALKILAIR